MSTGMSLTEDRFTYLDTLMNKVSRSFALVVPCLEKPLDYYVAAAYLICRVVDNIEDCERVLDWKKERFAEFISLLNEPASAQGVLGFWEQDTWSGLSPDEVRMMGVDDGLTLWQIYAHVPEEVRASIRRWVGEMAEGMGRVLDPDRAPYFLARNDVLIAANERDYDDYCYFVAGTVGHMVTDLVAVHYGLPSDVTSCLHSNVEACGRALQKTNVVKDFPKDLARGVCYLPDEWLLEVDYVPLSLAGAPVAWKHKVLNNVLDELEDSVAYVLDLPYAARGYRTASLLCMLPAYQTILLAAQKNGSLFAADHAVKISRETMLQCVQDAQSLVDDNEGIIRYSQSRRGAVEGVFADSFQIDG